jgi:hypothetical protein
MTKLLFKEFLFMSTTEDISNTDSYTTIRVKKGVVQWFISLFKDANGCEPILGQVVETDLKSRAVALKKEVTND